MQLSESEKEQADKYVLDISNTIISNIPLIVLSIVTIFYVTIFSMMMKTFTLPEMRIIAVFVFAYSVIRIMFSLTNSINFEYKPREK